MKNKQIARILHDSCPKNYQNTQIFMIFARQLPYILAYKSQNLRQGHTSKVMGGGGRLIRGS